MSLYYVYKSYSSDNSSNHTRYAKRDAESSEARDCIFGSLVKYLNVKSGNKESLISGRKIVSEPREFIRFPIHCELA